jgi:3-hydroxymyristoyl/3-hydroxydecanoyl-(acyl carrier protein) dehydratase
MHVEFCRVMSAEHPSLPGHFPGAPIVPGVVILDEVLAALNEWRGGSRIAEIPAVKFLAPLKPEQPFMICLSVVDESGTEVDFTCRVDDRVIVQGQLQVVFR